MRKTEWHLFLAVSGLACFSLTSPANAAPWMKDQADVSLKRLFENISPSGAASGAVVASPAKGEPGQPDYFYHWVRDAALVMDTVVTLYENATDRSEKKRFFDVLRDYISFSAKNQTTPNPSDGKSSGRLGEPKFLADGGAYNKGWGRPQNDGPALRAITLTRLANRWLDEGEDALVKAELYDGELPSSSVIKNDLEFVSHHWKLSSYDVWEEISGQHFYIRLVQRRALLEGAKLAVRLGDSGAAAWYRKQAGLLEAAIESHWDSSKALIKPTLDRDDGISYKTSDIDTVALLAVLHAAGDDGYFGVTDDRVLSTMEKQIAAFQRLYPVNSKGYGAVAMGRYPEDVYDGLVTTGTGNPWFLTTIAIAELHYRIAADIQSASRFDRTTLNTAFLDAVGATRMSRYAGNDKNDLIRKIRDRGDAFLSRACFHSGPGGRLAEQINRDSGYMQGARDLTWSYASYLTAFWRR